MNSRIMAYQEWNGDIEKPIINRPHHQKKKQLKNDNDKPTNPNRKREIAIAAGTAVGTALAAYGVYKVHKAIKDKHFKDLANQGHKYIKHCSEKGFWDDDFDYIKEVFNDAHDMSVSKIVKYHIGNNEVNGKVDWKRVYNRVKPW